MTDIKMPGLSGLDLIEKVRAAQLNTEFIILSGYGEFEFARTAMRYGVKHYLLKPSNETEITQVIMSCVETCKSKSASRVDSRKCHRKNFCREDFSQNYPGNRMWIWPRPR